MKACQYKRTGNCSVIEVTQVPAPKRSKGEVLIEIVASSVNPLDVKVRKGQFFPIALRLPKISGSDVAGIVFEADPGSKFKRGDRIFGFLDSGFPWKKSGTHAEFISTSEKQIAGIPDGVSFVDAAAASCVAVTAWQALDPDKLKPGQRVLIHAGSGGVGHFAIQYAKLAGAYVITTASAGNHHFLKELGADECIDYRQTDFCQQLSSRPVDVVVDSVGGDYTARSRRVLKKSGRYAHILQGGWSRFGYGPYVALLLEIRDVILGLIVGLIGWGPKHQPVGAMQDPALLDRITALMACGKLKVHIDKTFTLDQARAAHEYQEHGKPRGKIALKVKE
ncbi:hypothetical protein WJX74_005417 [Apatococcus lobatus]|uniref:Enoyl reductase (ER) domain-containing protein n=1 Tax=Apatococcus lobatus TaxID=904363 RepID=A0AAW1RBS3_9CHLO